VAKRTKLVDPASHRSLATVPAIPDIVFRHDERCSGKCRREY